MTQLTFVIPVAGYHQDIAARAIASVEAQIIPCEIVVFADTNGRGAGFARNRGLEGVHTPYVSFLDADDELAPTFAATCLAAIQPHQYVYTDWDVDGNHVQAPSPCDVWTKKTYHVVTTVMHTEDVQRIGGFDELLEGVEDSDFGVRLRLSGVCGIHVPQKLFYYGNQGQRAVVARQSGKELEALQYMTLRYGGYNFMGCCGDMPNTPATPGNEPLPGDVLVQAQWNGNRPEWGRATGRKYPRTSFPKLLYIAPEDLAASPSLWKLYSTTPVQVNGVVLQPQYQPNAAWQDVASAVFGGAQPQQMNQPVEYKPLQNPRTKGDVLGALKSK